jgi:anti-sigma factor RsiW
MSFSDRELKDFLAGDTSPEKTHEIEAAMMSDQAVERRIMTLDSIAPLVRDVMVGIPSAERLEKIEKSLTPVAPKQKPVWGMRIAASLAVGIFVGWLGSESLRKDPSVGWRAEVASYQSLYVAETVAWLNSDAEAITKQFKKASDALGLDLHQEALAQVDALTLGRAQVLGFKGRPLIQIVFKSETGEPIALCIIKSKQTSESTKLALQEMKGMASAAWNGEEHEFFLIGGQNAQEIEQWATRFKGVFSQT